MTSQIEKAKLFGSLHVPGDPVVLYNIWDAGSAAAVTRAGAKAIATGSWSVAAAQGYGDGENMPLDDVLRVVRRIVQSTDLPVTVDFEGGYALETAEIAANVRRLLECGAIGLNFEDQVVHGPGLHEIAEQSARLRAVRQTADGLGIPLFINARTDVFLKAQPGTDHAGLIDEALAREAAYREAGADSFFVPGLTDAPLIRTICERSVLPINVMMAGNLKDVGEVAMLGVGRISFGPAPFIKLMDTLQRDAQASA